MDITREELTALIREEATRLIREKLTISVQVDKDHGCFGGYANRTRVSTTVFVELDGQQVCTSKDYFDIRDDD